MVLICGRGSNFCGFAVQFNDESKWANGKLMNTIFERMYKLDFVLRGRGLPRLFLGRFITDAVV